MARSKIQAAVSDVVIPAVAGIMVPIAMDKGAQAFCESIPLEWLEKILLKHHDEYGEFAYNKCAKEIRSRLIKQASRNFFQQHPKQSGGGGE